METVPTAMAITFRLPICAILELALIATAAAQPLFESKRLTPDEYTFGIEGPAVDAAGVFYAVNFRRQGTIGRLIPGAGQSELVAELPAGSVGYSFWSPLNSMLFGFHPEGMTGL